MWSEWCISLYIYLFGGSFGFLTWEIILLILIVYYFLPFLPCTDISGPYFGGQNFGHRQQIPQQPKQANLNFCQQLLSCWSAQTCCTDGMFLSKNKVHIQLGKILVAFQMILTVVPQRHQSLWTSSKMPLQFASFWITLRSEEVDTKCWEF